MIWWTGLAPREFEFSFPGSLISTLMQGTSVLGKALLVLTGIRTVVQEVLFFIDNLLV